MRSRNALPRLLGALAFAPPLAALLTLLLIGKTAHAQWEQEEWGWCQKEVAGEVRCQRWLIDGHRYYYYPDSATVRETPIGKVAFRRT